MHCSAVVTLSWHCHDRLFGTFKRSPMLFFTQHKSSVLARRSSLSARVASRCAILASRQLGKQDVRDVRDMRDARDVRDVTVVFYTCSNIFKLQYPFSILSVSFQYPLAPGWILDDIFRSSHGRWKQACNSERDEKCLMVFPHASFHGKIVQPRAVSRPRKDKKIKQSEFQYFRQRFPERIPVGTLEQSFFHSEDGTAFDFG
jgi:hypothetical protein